MWIFSCSRRALGQKEIWAQDERRFDERCRLLSRVVAHVPADGQSVRDGVNEFGKGSERLNNESYLQMFMSELEQAAW